MKKILNIINAIILITLLSCQVFATNWYVDKDAGGSNNGTSWTNAWVNVTGIGWGSLHAGDTVFVSDGSYGDLTLNPSTSGTATNYIVIISAKYAYHSIGMAGHQGLTTLSRIVIDNSGTAAADYIKVKGFEVTGSNIHFDVDDPAISKGLYFESIYLHDYGSQFGFRVIAHTDSLIVDSCIVIDCLDGAGACSGQRDCMHFNYDGNTYPRNTILRNNWMEMRSQDPTAHNDVIQSATADGFTIYNNIFISDSVNSPEGGGMPLILSSNDIDQNNYPPVLVFNNFCYMGGLWYDNASDGRVFMTRHDGNSSSNYQSPTYIFNNTLVNSGPRDQVMDQEYHIDFFSNNIDASFCPSAYRSSPHGWYNSLDAGDAYGGHMYRDSTRHNLFWRQDNNQGFFGGSFYTTGTSTFSPSNWSTWTSGGGTGVNANPLFVDDFGYEPDQAALTGKITVSSPAIGAGENLTYLANYLASTYNLPNDIKAAMLKDKEGKSRGTVWDIGAYQYVAGAWTPPDTIPSFSFTSVTGANLSTEYVASSTFTGADTTFYVWSTGAEFQINGGGYSTTTKTAISGDIVYVKNNSSSSYLTATTSTIIAGGQSRNFVVTTKAALDTIPNSFTFTDITGATRSFPFTSNGITLSGFDSAYAYSGGNIFTVNNGSDLTAYTRVHTGDVLRLKLTSSSSYSTSVNRTLTVGGISDTYTVTTLADPGSPSGTILKGSNGLLIKDSTGKIIKTKP